MFVLSVFIVLLSFMLFCCFCCCCWVHNKKSIWNESQFLLCECWQYIEKAHTHSECKWLCVFPLDFHCFSRLDVGFLSHSLRCGSGSVSGTSTRGRSTKTKRYRDAWIVANKRLWLVQFIHPIEQRLGYCKCKCIGGNNIMILQPSQAINECDTKIIQQSQSRWKSKAFAFTPCVSLSLVSSEVVRAAKLTKYRKLCSIFLENKKVFWSSLCKLSVQFLFEANQLIR